MADKNDASPASAQPPAESAPTAPPAASAAPAGTAAPAVATQRTGWTRYLTPALALVAALIVGGVAGVLIGQSTASAGNASSVRGGFPGGGEGFPGFGGGQGDAGAGSGTAGGRGGFTAGTITSISGGEISLKEANGTTITVSTTGSTSVTKSSTAKVSDLATGETITVIGQADASGNVTATRISEGTAGAFGGFGGGAPSHGATPAPTN